MPRLGRRVLGVLDSLLILVGAVFFAGGVLDLVVWILASGLGTPVSNPTFLLDQRMHDRIGSQAIVWMPAGAFLVVGGVTLWSCLRGGEGDRMPPPPPGRALRVAPVVLGAGLALLLVASAVASIPLPQRVLVFADADFPMGGTDSGQSFRGSDAFYATAAEILTGTFRQIFTDIMTGDQFGPVVLNSSVSLWPTVGPLMVVLPTSATWAYLVTQDGHYFVTVSGGLGICPATLGCPENYTTQISGHVTATGPALYTVESLILLLPGVALTVPPAVLWRLKIPKASKGGTR